MLQLSTLRAAYLSVFYACHVSISEIQTIIVHNVVFILGCALVADVQSSTCDITNSSQICVRFFDLRTPLKGSTLSGFALLKR